jgi:beta-glucanase (GH16 family)
MKVISLSLMCMSPWLIALSEPEAALAATPLAPATWGTPDQAWGSRRPVTPADRASIAEYRSGHKQVTYSTDFKSSAQFQKDWQSLSDDKAGLKACRRSENAQVTSEGLRLRTLVAHDCQTSWSTGTVISRFQQKYGFFEARMKIADIGGMNNAFWLTAPDQYEIDITEYRLPNYDHMNLCNWDKTVKDHTVGLQVQFAENLSQGFHDFGVLWTPNELIFEVDGDPVGAIVTHDAIGGAANLRFSTALADWAGKGAENPVGHDMVVQSVRVFAR